MSIIKSDPAQIDMKQTKQNNRQIMLAARPNGAPVATDFKLEVSACPAIESGQVLLCSVYLSLDPYMRGRMSEAKSYAAPLALGDVMLGGTVSRVEASQHADYNVGDWVLSYNGWQDYAVSDGDGLTPLGAAPARPSYALGIMGMPGFTAYMGLLDIGKPKRGETLVVAAATGPVGATVGQIGKLKGCRVVGVAGSAEKCRYAVDALGFDACIDRKATDFEKQLAIACSDGIDIYYENVGGNVFDAVLPLLNTSARIPVCGLISQYNAKDLPDGPDRLSSLMGAILTKRLTVRGFIIFDDYGHLYPDFAKDMSTWLADGKIKYREQIVEGLENGADAFMGLLEGKNFGKLVIRIGDDQL
jgi:NADPH-dependent curcumin reductase CurA